MAQYRDDEIKYGRSWSWSDGLNSLLKSSAPGKGTQTWASNNVFRPCDPSAASSEGVQRKKTPNDGGSPELIGAGAMALEECEGKAARGGHDGVSCSRMD